MFLVRSVATRYYFRLFKCLYIIIVQVIFYFPWDHLSHPSYFKNRMPLKPALGLGGGGGGRGWGAYATSQTTVLHMNRLNQTEFLVFLFL